MVVSPISRPGADAAGLAELHGRVVRRYRGCSRFARGFVAGKMRRDPVHPAVLRRAAAAPFGRVVDLGCGRGQLGLALLEAGVADSVIGIDWDGRQLADAREAAVGVPASFLDGNLADAAVPACDTVLIIDALCQMRHADQLAVVERAAASARRQMLIRTFDPERGWRSLVGFALEGGLWLSGRYRRGAISPAPVRELVAVVDEAGFTITVEPCWAGTPLPNVLLVATRREGGA